MHFELNETQRLVQKTARDYATRVILPQAADDRQHERFPREILKGLAELGLMAVNVPAALGGAAAGAVAYALAMQEIARACASTAVTMAVTNMVGEVIAALRDGGAAAAHCPKLASGEYAAGAFALSEPEAGSDPGGMRDDGDARRRRVGPRRREAVDHERRPRGRVRRVGADGRPRDAPGHARHLVLPRRRGSAGAEGRARPRTRWASAGRTPSPLELDGVPRPRERAPRRAERGLQDRDDGARRRAHRHQRAGDRHRPRRARGERRLREGAASSSIVPIARLPGHPVEARRHRRPSSTRRTCSACARRGSRRRAARSRARRRWRSSSRARPRTASATTPSRSTAATATCASSPPSGTCATSRVTTIYEGTSEIQRIVIARSTLQG